MPPATPVSSARRTSEPASLAATDWFQLRDPEGNSVLESPTSLARALARTDLFGYKGTATLATVLTLVFGRKRRCPERLVQPLQRLFDSRVAVLAPDEAERRSEEFRTFLGKRVVGGFRDEVESLLSEVRRCEVCFGIIPEGVATTDCGDIVLNAMVARALAAESSGAPVRFLVCFPDVPLANSFLDSLLLKLARDARGETDLEAAKELLRRLEESRVFQFRILPASSELTFFPPMVIVDPHRGDASSGFNLYLFSDSSPAISTMHSAVVRQAIQSIYKPLVTERFEAVRRISADREVRSLARAR